MKITNTACLALIAGSALVVGCHDAEPAKDPVTGESVKTQDGKVINKAAADEFKKAVAELTAHDTASDWNDSACESSAKHFENASGKLSGGEFFEARYNAGVAFQRCKQDSSAKGAFKKILAENPKFHRARVQVALYEFVASGQKDVDPAIKEMQQAVDDAEFKNEEALVHLAMLQMLRDNDVKDDDGATDFERAKLNLQRALAVNDGFMPAFNQLAVYYLESAKKKARQSEKGDKTRTSRKRSAVKAAAEDERRADSQALELAQLVCSQAIRKNPNYAPIYNTMGLISSELGDLSQAAQSFGKARGLDAKFYEAHMNYAAVNLQFRGFEESATAYKASVGLRPNDYEAHLGLALAFRGLITDKNFDEMLGAAQRELAEARKIDAARPETYYNEAILVEEFKTKTVDGEKAEPLYAQAKGLFKQFIEKATGKEEYTVAVKRAEERMKDIDDIVAVIKDNAAAAKNPAPAPAPPAAPAPTTDAAPGVPSGAPSAEAPKVSAAPPAGK